MSRSNFDKPFYVDDSRRVSMLIAESTWDVLPVPCARKMEAYPSIASSHGRRCLTRKEVRNEKCY